MGYRLIFANIHAGLIGIFRMLDFTILWYFLHFMGMYNDYIIIKFYEFAHNPQF